MSDNDDTSNVNKHGEFGEKSERFVEERVQYAVEQQDERKKCNIVPSDRHEDRIDQCAHVKQECGYAVILPKRRWSALGKGAFNLRQPR